MSAKDVLAYVCVYIGPRISCECLLYYYTNVCDLQETPKSRFTCTILGLMLIKGS